MAFYEQNVPRACGLELVMFLTIVSGSEQMSPSKMLRPRAPPTATQTVNVKMHKNTRKLHEKKEAE